MLKRAILITAAFILALASSPRGDQIVIRVSVDKINAIAGANVVGTTSTATSADAQILVGTSVTGGLLLNSDSATGSDFVVQ